MDKITILGHKVNVMLVDGMVYNSGNRATCGPEKLEIRIDKQLPYTMKVHALTHEIVEFLNEELELGLEHKVITALGTGIAHVILDNEFPNVRKP